MRFGGPQRLVFVPAIFALSMSISACRDKPEEISTPVLTAAAAPAIMPLEYEVPGTWTKVSTSQTGNKRAVYKAPKTGSDTEDAELTVFFFGTGSQGDPDRLAKEWGEEFDADALGTTTRKSFDAPAGKVEIIELMGTYKIALGPKIGPGKKAPMQMVKEKWRLYGAVVRTKERGNWFFKLVGPNETVLASKGGLESALQAAK